MSQNERLQLYGLLDSESHRGKTVYRAGSLVNSNAEGIDVNYTQGANGLWRNFLGVQRKRETRMGFRKDETV